MSVTVFFPFFSPFSEKKSNKRQRFADQFTRLGNITPVVWLHFWWGLTCCVHTFNVPSPELSEGKKKNASNKTRRIHAQTLNTEPLREHGAPLLALIHFKMQMGGFEIQPVCVMLGYFNVVSMLGIILSTAGEKKKNWAWMAVPSK